MIPAVNPLGSMLLEGLKRGVRSEVKKSVRKPPTDARFQLSVTRGEFNHFTPQERLEHREAQLNKPKTLGTVPENLVLSRVSSQYKEALQRGINAQERYIVYDPIAVFFRSGDLDIRYHGVGHVKTRKSFESPHGVVTLFRRNMRLYENRVLGAPANWAPVERHWRFNYWNDDNEQDEDEGEDSVPSFQSKEYPDRGNVHELLYCDKEIYEKKNVIRLYTGGMGFGRGQKKQFSVFEKIYGVSEADVLAGKAKAPLDRDGKFPTSSTMTALLYAELPEVAPEPEPYIMPIPASSRLVYNNYTWKTFKDELKKQMEHDIAYLQQKHPPARCTRFRDSYRAKNYIRRRMDSEVYWFTPKSCYGGPNRVFKQKATFDIRPPAPKKKHFSHGRAVQ